MVARNLELRPLNGDNGIDYAHVRRPACCRQGGLSTNQSLPPVPAIVKHSSLACPPSDNLRRTIHSRGHCRQPRPARKTENCTSEHESTASHATSDAHSHPIQPGSVPRCRPRPHYGRYRGLNTAQHCLTLFNTKFFPAGKKKAQPAEA